jgi:predicted RNA binding protein YcfA (HicA-like mRNA interferase family)
VPKLPRVTAAEVLAALARDGWYQSRQSGSHVILRHPSKPGIVPVPFHRGTLKTGTLASILTQAGLTGDQLRHLL